MKYRVQKTIDVLVEEDSDGDIRYADILGVEAYSRYTRPEELRQTGWTVTAETTPEQDPPGTLRRFVDSGDRAIKDLNGQWRYLYPASGVVSGSEFRNYPTAVTES